jgi:hypothetical protein
MTVRVSEIVSNYWKFTRVDGEGALIAPVVRFWPSGMVGGYIHDYERCWDLEGDTFRLKNISGQTTTLFDEHVFDENGLLSMKGRSTVDPSVVHMLERAGMPFIRDFGYTSSADEAVFKISDSVQKGRRRNLVILRANDKSLHTQWPVDIAEEDRNWDLCISWYGRELPEDIGAYEYLTHQPNDWKFSAIYKLFLEGSPLLDYENIYMPDDDLMMSWKDINRLFNIFRIEGLRLAQPALTKESYVNHKITEKNPEFYLRYTSFVELMCPVFTREFLQICLPAFDATITGWGLDHVWSLLLGRVPGCIAIIDDIAVTHTRPPQNSYDLATGVKEDFITCALYRTKRPQQMFGGILGQYKI